eukprot:8850010-Pyramimonas_sp.AAC.1
MVHFFTYLELQMSLRALPHRNQKNIMRHASLKYLDAWLGCVMSAEAEQLGNHQSNRDMYLDACNQSAISARAEKLFVLCQLFAHNIRQGSSTSLQA